MPKPYTVLCVSVISHCLAGCDGTLPPDGPSADAAVPTAISDAGDCAPTSCAREGKDCGTISDGCGNELDCGECQHGECGAMVPNVCACNEPQTALTERRTGRTASSSGFDGPLEDYAKLFQVECVDVNDCVDACLSAGGSDALCGASECSTNAEGNKDCSPAPVWRDVENISFEGSSREDGVNIVVLDSDYSDALLVSNFGFEIPDSADIEGLVVEVHRAGDQGVADRSIRLLSGNETVGSDRAGNDTWGDAFEWVAYGAADDDWGRQWSANEVNADDFGVSLAVFYTRNAGNTRAYVDQVRVTVHYSLACD